MSLGKTTKKETSQQIDPALARESHNLAQLFKQLASSGYEPNRGVTIAGFTPAQEAAHKMTNDAAASFGFAPAEGTGMPETETSASGVEGYSTDEEYDASVAALPADFRRAINRAYRKMGKTTKYKKFSPSSGGKK